MDIPVELNVVKFELSTWLIGLYLLLVGLAYFLIFRKHHKRNEVEIFELVNLVTKFFVITTVSIVVIVFGIDCILVANQYLETRSDVIGAIITGILLISVTIINYIFYLKRALQDYEIVERQENKKKTLQIGEWLQLIFFIIMIFMPIIRIPYFIKVFEDKVELAKDIFRSFFISFAAMFVLYSLNPLNIKEKLLKVSDENKTKEEVEEKAEEKVEEKNDDKKKNTSKKSTSKKTETAKKSSNSASKKTSSSKKKTSETTKKQTKNSKK